MSFAFQVKAYLRYLLHAKYHGGFSVHSPFAYRLITEVMEEKLPYYIYEPLERRRRQLKRDKTKVHVEDYGTRPSGERVVSDIANCSLKKRKYAQLLFRLVNDLHPKNVVELGTSLGITTAYLAKAASGGEVHTFDGSEALIDIARKTVETVNVKNVIFHRGNIDEVLEKVLKQLKEVDFAFIDANHTGEATKRYFNAILTKISPRTLIVIDDIHSSESMESAWLSIVSNERVTVSFDLFSMGMVFFNPELQRQSYIYKF